MIELRRDRVGPMLLAAAVVTLAPWVYVAAQDAEPPEDPVAVPTGVTESVEVVLVEIKLRAVDNKGQPVTDLNPDEISVFQGGVEQRLAYLEPLTKRTGDLSLPEVVYDGRGDAIAPVEAQAAVVLPPKPVRRVILAFDPRNSRIPVRDDWRAAALEWAEESMQPKDMVGVVVLKPWPEWVVTLTSNREEVIQAIKSMDLSYNVPNRSRRDELNSFIDEISGLCVDTSGGRDPGGSSNRGNELSAQATACAYELARPRVWDWTVQSEESMEGLRSLTGELAAIPGQKSVILFSEGMIEDPATVAAYTMASILGRAPVDIFSMTNRLRGSETLPKLAALYNRAGASDVVFFTIDTRSQNQSVNFDMEHNARITNPADEVDPYREMYDSSRAPLANLANATGGRPFYGPDKLTWKIRTAADSFYGIYGLGYYRSEETSPGGRIKVKVERKKVNLTYEKKPQRRRHQPRAPGLNLAIGQPKPSGDGDKQTLPVALVIALETLPLRKGGGGFGCELGVFLQAVRPDGSVAGEYFETTAVVLDKDQRASAKGRNFRFVFDMNLPPGPMRILARLSDDRQDILGERSLDLTLGQGSVRAGLETSE